MSLALIFVAIAPALWMRVIVFPWGRAYTAPGDALDHEVANLLLEPGVVRERLTGGVFFGCPRAGVGGARGGGNLPVRSGDRRTRTCAAPTGDRGG
jgi:hypothetical protein